MGISILSLLDELRIIAQNGLHYADNPYDEERYTRILTLVSEYYSMRTNLSTAELTDRFETRLGHVTPNVGGRAVVIDDDGRLFLIKRTDDGTWALPGGYTDPGETPADTVVRETKEETGLTVQPVELVNLYNRSPDEQNPHGFVGVAYLCEVTGGTQEVSHEGESLQYWHREEVPEWHKDHEQTACDAQDIWENRKR